MPNRSDALARTATRHARGLIANRLVDQEEALAMVSAAQVIMHQAEAFVWAVRHAEQAYPELNQEVYEVFA